MRAEILELVGVHQKTEILKLLETAMLHMMVNLLTSSCRGNVRFMLAVKTCGAGSSLNVHARTHTTRATIQDSIVLKPPRLIPK